MISSPKTQFVRTAQGQKTAKMLEVELALGRTLEEDFREYHLEKGWGQKRLADRWGVKKNQIFCSNPRTRNRCWADILNLPVRRIDAEPVQLSQRRAPEQETVPTQKTAQKRKCEACDEPGTHFDRAHWISAATGGSTQSMNILRLCPNCHRKLDRDDAVTIERCKESLLYREAKRILDDGPDSRTKQMELVRACEAIVRRKVT